MMTPFNNPQVAGVFADYPPGTRVRLEEIRELILETAAQTDGVGPLEEALRWGQPSFITSTSKSGSTFRIDAVHKLPGTVAVYFHCQSGIVPAIRKRFGKSFRYEGKRALLFAVDAEIPRDELRACIRLALTWRQTKTKRTRT